MKLAAVGDNVNDMTANCQTSTGCRITQQHSTLKTQDINDIRVLIVKVSHLLPATRHRVYRLLYFLKYRDRYLGGGAADCFA